MDQDRATSLLEASDHLEFDCPRCAATVRERFWGPCQACRSELNESFRGEAREVEATRFEPAMHVVPNQVATKE
jgi:hypothetical protein